jgi:two-component system, NarL family, sensor histidine kinase UhpB
MKKTILIVEDNPADRKIIDRYIKAFQTACESHFCESLTEAQEWLNHQTPDMMLLDLNLPDSLDTDTLQIVSTMAKNLPIIVLTGHNNQDIALRSIQQGFQDFLRKGEFDERILEKTILFSLERYAILQRLDTANHKITTLNKALENKVLERTQDLADSQKELIKHLPIYGKTSFATSPMKYAPPSPAFWAPYNS